MKVTLRQKKQIKKISLYLDYYDKGERQYEFLDLYLYPEPPMGRLTKEQRRENENAIAIAEAIRSKRHLDIQNKRQGFPKYDKANTSFIRYLENDLIKRVNEDRNAGVWNSAIIQIKNFETKDITFADINKEWLDDLKSFLQYKAKKKNGQLLSINTQISYFGKVCAVLDEPMTLTTECRGGLTNDIIFGI
jgi:hypothetical protein